MSLTINIYNFGNAGKQDRILAGIAELKEIAMTLKQDLDTLIAALDEATTAIGTRIDALTQSIKNNMTDDEVADVKAKMSAEVDKLKAMGTDPSNPVPPPVDQPAA